MSENSFNRRVFTSGLAGYATAAVAAAVLLPLSATTSALSQTFNALNPLGEPYVPFNPDDVVPGQPLANGWAWPAASKNITQWFHDVYALDIAGPVGDLLYSPYAGEVVAVGAEPGYTGRGCPTSWWRGTTHRIVVKHEYLGNLFYSGHLHIMPGSSAALNIRTGSIVESGQPIARIGMTGCTTGPHTHFFLADHFTNYLGNVNPIPYIGTPLKT